jgi:hypothetical protein
VISVTIVSSNLPITCDVYSKTRFGIAFAVTLPTVKSGFPMAVAKGVTSLVISSITTDTLNFITIPNDTCMNCGWTGEINDNCPECNSTDIKRLRRVTGLSK